MASWGGGRSHLEQGDIQGVIGTGLGPPVQDLSHGPVGARLELGFLGCWVRVVVVVRLLDEAAEIPLPTEPAEPPPPVPCTLPPQPGWHRLPFGCCEYPHWGPGSKSLPSAPLLNLCHTAGRCCHPIPAGMWLCGDRRKGALVLGQTPLSNPYSSYYPTTHPSLGCARGHNIG